MRNQVNNKDLTIVLRAHIKAGLQVCHNTLNKSKHPEMEYRLFNRLAELYLIKEEAREYPKVAAIYQYLRKLVEKHLNGDKEKLASIDQRIKGVESRFLIKIKVPKRDLKNEEPDNIGVDVYKEELSKFREEIKKGLLDIEYLGIEKDKEELNEEGLQKRAQGVQRLYMDIRKFFIGKRNEAGKLTQPGLVNRLIDDCIKQLGGLPRVGKDNHECSYAIFGMGSMALGTMTPWSDIEFGILIEDGLTKEEEARVKEHFRLVTVLLHIKVVNFGETPLRMMGIEEINNFKLAEKSDPEHNWFFDNLINSGFSFDGPHWHACKTPLGRADGYQKASMMSELILCAQYELIGTVSEFMKFFKLNSWYGEDPQLVQALEHAVIINGSKKLLEQYQEMLDRIEEISKRRAFEILKRDCEELTPYKQIFDEDKEGQILKVKKEIYRFPDRIVAAIGSCYGTKQFSCWEVLTRLDINKDGRRNLKIALSISTELRLRTYSHNNSQSEDLSALSRYDSELEVLRNDMLIEQVFYLKDQRFLYWYYYVLLPIADIVDRCSQIGDLQAKLNENNLFQVNSTIRGLIFYRFSRYYEAINELEKVPNKKFFIKNILAVFYNFVGKYEQSYNLLMDLIKQKEGDNSEITLLPGNLGNCLANLGRYREALLRHEESLEKLKRFFRGNHPRIAAALNNIGNAFKNLGRYEEAYQYLLKSLRMREKIYKCDHPAIASSKNNIAIILTKLGRYEDALQYAHKSFEMLKRMYKGDHYLIASLLDNISNILCHLGEFEDALKYAQSSLELRKRIYKGNNSFIVASLNNIGNTLALLGRYENALAVLYDSYEMINRIHIGEHANISKLLNNLGSTLRRLGRPEEALKLLYKSLEMGENLYKGDHPDICEISDEISKTLSDLGEYEEALKYINKSLEMRKNLYRGDHSDIASSLNIRGSILERLKRYQESLLDRQQDLEMSRRIHKGNHPDIAAALNNVGNALSSLGRYDDALIHVSESLEMLKKIYKGDHADIADALNNYGGILKSLARNQEVMDYQLRSLEMKKRIYKGDHPSIADSLHNIFVDIMEISGNYNEAFKIALECLEMRKKIYKKDHIDIAAALTNMGDVLGNLGQHDKALYYYQNGLNMKRRICRASSTSIADSLANIIHSLNRLKRYNEALPLAYECLKIRKEAYAGDHPDIAAALSNIGSILAGLERYKEALAFACESLEMKKRNHKKDHISIVVPLNNISIMLFRMGRYEEALQKSMEAREILVKLCIPNDDIYAQTVQRQLFANAVASACNAMLAGDKEAAIEYYNIVVKNPSDLTSLTINMALQACELNNINLAILCYIALSEKLAPTNRDVKHNLACMYHIKALEEKEQGHQERFRECLSKSAASFEAAISLETKEKVTTSTYVEYSQFLLKHCDKTDKQEYNKIKGLLELAITLEDSSELGYNQFEKSTVCEPLQELLNKQKEVTIKPKLLAYYLLIRVFAIYNNIEIADNVLQNFKEQLHILQTSQDCFVGYHLLEAAHKELIAEAVEEVSSSSALSSILPRDACKLIAEYEGSLSYNLALGFNNEGILSFKSKNYSTAIVAYSKAVGLSFTNPISEVLYNRGKAYHESNSIDEAMKDYQELIRVNSSHVKAYYQLGCCFKQKGNLLLAETFWKQALEKDPKLDIAQKALDEINKVISGNIASKMEQQRITQQQSYQRH